MTTGRMVEGIFCRGCGKRVPLVDVGVHELDHAGFGPAEIGATGSSPVPLDRTGGKVDTRPPDESGMDTVDLHEPESLSGSFHRRAWRDGS